MQQIHETNRSSDKKKRFISKLRIYQEQHDIHKISTPEQMAQRRFKTLKSVLEIQKEKLLKENSLPIPPKLNQDSIQGQEPVETKQNSNFGIRAMIQAHLPYLQRNPIELLQNRTIQQEKQDSQATDRKEFKANQKNKEPQTLENVNIFSQGNQLGEYKSKQQQVFNFTNNNQVGFKNTDTSIEPKQTTIFEPKETIQQNKAEKPSNKTNLFGFQPETTVASIFTQGNPFYQEKMKMTTEQFQQEPASIFTQPQQENCTNIFNQPQQGGRVNIFSQPQQDKVVNIFQQNQDSSKFGQNTDNKFPNTLLQNNNLFAKPNQRIDEKPNIFGQIKHQKIPNVLPETTPSIFTQSNNENPPSILLPNKNQSFANIFGQAKDQKLPNFSPDQKVPNIFATSKTENFPEKKIENSPNIFTENNQQKPKSIFSQDSSNVNNIFMQSNINTQQAQSSIYQQAPKNISANQSAQSVAEQNRTQMMLIDSQAIKNLQKQQAIVPPAHTLSMAPQVGSDNDHISQIESKKSEQAQNLVGDKQKTESLKDFQRQKLPSIFSTNINHTQEQVKNIFANQSKKPLQQPIKETAEKGNLLGLKTNIFGGSTSANSNIFTSSKTPTPSNIFAATSDSTAPNIFTGNPSSNIFSNTNLFNQNKGNTMFSGLTPTGNMFINQKQSFFAKKVDEEDQQGDEEDDNQIVQGQQLENNPQQSTGKYEDYIKTEVLFKQPALKFKRLVEDADLIENITVSIEQIEGVQYPFLFIRLANKVITFKGNIVPNVTQVQSINNSNRNISIKKILIPKSGNPVLESCKLQFKTEQMGLKFIQKVTKK